MKSNAYTRLMKRTLSEESKPLHEYSAKELVAYAVTNYPNDPVGAVDQLLENLEIGSVLFHTTVVILEGMGYVKKH